MRMGCNFTAIREQTAHAVRDACPLRAAALSESLTAFLHVVLPDARLRKLSLSGQLRGGAGF